MCFAPQRRPLFRHLNFQKCSDTEVFCTFWLGNVLRATTACTFSSSQFPKVDWGHHFLHFWLGNVLRATTAWIFHVSSPQTVPHPPLWQAYFSTLRSHKSLEKTQCFATILPFRAPASSFLWLFPRTLSLLRSSLIFFHLFFFSFLLFSSLIFFLLIFSYLFFSFLLFSSLPSLHIVGSLTSKLPSTI